MLTDASKIPGLVTHPLYARSHLATYLFSNPSCKLFLNNLFSIRTYVMIVSLLIFILPYSQPSHSSHHTLFVIFLLLTINMIHESSTILHQPHFAIKIYYSRVFYSLDSRPSYYIHVSQLMFDSIDTICCNPMYYNILLGLHLTAIASINIDYISLTLKLTAYFSLV